jgi:hypothetical protein
MSKTPKASQPMTVTLPYTVWTNIIQNLQWAQAEAGEKDGNPEDEYVWRSRAMDMLANHLAASVDANFMPLEAVYIYERPLWEWRQVTWVAGHTLWHFMQYALQHLAGENPFLYHEVTCTGAQSYYPVVEEIEGSFRFSLFKTKEQAPRCDSSADSPFPKE